MTPEARTRRDGGNVVVLTGSGFKHVTGVTFGTTPAAFTVDSPTQITVTVPPAPRRRVQVRVTTKTGKNPLVVRAGRSTPTRGRPPRPPADGYRREAACSAALAAFSASIWRLAASACSRAFDFGLAFFCGRVGRSPRGPCRHSSYSR